MEAWFKIIMGLVLLLVSVGYLYRPSWVYKWHTWGRSLFFNDAFVLLYRRRLGALFLLGALLFCYSGFSNLASQTEGFYLAPGDLSKPIQSFQQGLYEQSIEQCQRVIRESPEHREAWWLMGAAWAALGEEERAQRCWRHVLSLHAHRGERISEGENL